MVIVNPMSARLFMLTPTSIQWCKEKQEGTKKVEVLKAFKLCIKNLQLSPLSFRLGVMKQQFNVLEFSKG